MKKYKYVGNYRGIDYGDKYKVYNDGHMVRKDRLSCKYVEAKESPHKDGYPMISLYSGKGKNSHHKRETMHRLVASLFVPNPRDLPQVNHINGLKDDNRVENLEWVTDRDNKLHAYKTGLKVVRFGSESSGSKFDEMQILTAMTLLENGSTQKVIADYMGTSQSHVCAINKGAAWSWMTGYSKTNRGSYKNLIVEEGVL